MKDIGQQYQSLLNKEIDVLERERRKDYEYLFDNLARQGMVRADIHIEQALELERKYMQCFLEYAITQYMKLGNSPKADMNMLGKIYRQEINAFFGRSLQRMLGIVSNVRGSITDTFVLKLLEKVKSEAFKAFENAKVH